MQTRFTGLSTVLLSHRGRRVSLYEEIQDTINFLEDSPYNVSRQSASQKLVSFQKHSKFLSMKSRLATFNDFIFDKQKGSKCTSKKLARAGFYSTSSKEPTVKCPFCLVTLEFEKKDDPWNEHKKFNKDCDYVKLNNVNDENWTLEESLMMSARIVVMKKFEMGQRLINKLESQEKENEMKVEINKLMPIPRMSRRLSV